MSTSFEKVIIVGNLGKTPELRYANDKAVTNLDVAINKSWTGSDGQRQEKTKWVNITVWGKQAENCAQYLEKGQQVIVEAETKAAKPYQNNSGEWVSNIELTAKPFGVVFGPKSKSSNGNGNGNGSSQRTSRPQSQATDEDLGIPMF